MTNALVLKYEPFQVRSASSFGAESRPHGLQAKSISQDRPGDNPDRSGSEAIPLLGRKVDRTVSKFARPLWPHTVVRSFVISNRSDLE